jgi:hypothetical protein
VEGSSPYLGEKDRLETVVEYKVELVCEDGIVREALRALKAAHPYEEPAYDIYRLEAF